MAFDPIIYTPGSQIKSADLNLLKALANAKRSCFPTPFKSTNWAINTVGGGTALWLEASGAADGTIDLDIPQGLKLSKLSLYVNGGGTQTVTIAPQQAFADDGTHSGVTDGPVSMGALTVTAGPVGADQTLNMLAASSTTAGGTTVTVNAAGGTYTRSSGSYIADGLFLGQIVQWSGFANAGNNAKKTIVALTATVMTVSTVGLVDEVGAANAAQANGVSPAVDSSFGIQLKLTTTGAGPRVRGLRYECVAA